MSLIYDALKLAEKRRKLNQSAEESAPESDAAVFDSAAAVAELPEQDLVQETFTEDEKVVTGAIAPLQADEIIEPLDLDAESLQLQLAEQLKQENKITDADLSKMQRMCEEKPNVSFLDLLTRLGLVSDNNIAQALSTILQLPLVAKEQFPKQSIVEDLISNRFLKEQKIMPLAIDDDHILVAMANPADIETREAIALACDREVNVRVGVASEIDAGLDQIGGDRSSQMDQILDDAAIEEISDEDVDHLKDLASEAPVIRLVNLLIQRAAEQHASDIHIEPFEGQLKVRYRIDGVLKEVESPPRQFAAAIISRIKIMAKLNIAERRLPQDGRIRSRLQGKEFDMRISTIPTMHGESVVIRLLNQESVVLDFESLGFSGKTREQLIEALRMPHGMILITGPTGSGKTTTLYTALSMLNEPNRKIITVEDPIEYQLEGINQIQAKSAIGLTFASALRSIVRQDPDVIMVGEMRDLETAEICIKSALTGHLVLSTLHTNDAASSITRLIEMRVEDYLLTSTLNAVVAQRLVRVLCEHCKVPQTAPQKFVTDCRSNNVHIHPNAKVYTAKGCSKCGDTGYQGRTCIIELLRLDEGMKQKILQHADANELMNYAIQHGMQTMYQDGLAKVLAGVTTIEEITRVTKE